MLLGQSSATAPELMPRVQTIPGNKVCLCEHVDGNTSVEQRVLICRFARVHLIILGAGRIKTRRRPVALSRTVRLLDGVTSDRIQIKGTKVHDGRAAPTEHLHREPHSKPTLNGTWYKLYHGIERGIFGLRRAYFYRARSARVS